MSDITSKIIYFQNEIFTLNIRMKFLEDENNTQKHRVKDLEKEKDILRQQKTLQSQKLIFNVNEIGKEIKKVERDLANLGYSQYMLINELTREVNRINVLSSRNIYEYGVETNEQNPFLFSLYLFNFLSLN
jgi:predicted  nucleic acid-binding Zn-ribbon protein